jgi:hypothetical protein
MSSLFFKVAPKKRKQGSEAEDVDEETLPEIEQSKPIAPIANITQEEENEDVIDNDSESVSKKRKTRATKKKAPAHQNAAECVIVIDNAIYADLNAEIPFKVKGEWKKSLDSNGVCVIAQNEFRVCKFDEKHSIEFIEVRVKAEADKANENYYTFVTNKEIFEAKLWHRKWCMCLKGAKNRPFLYGNSSKLQDGNFASQVRLRSVLGLSALTRNQLRNCCKWTTEKERVAYLARFPNYEDIDKPVVQKEKKTNVPALSSLKNEGGDARAPSVKNSLMVPVAQSTNDESESASARISNLTLLLTKLIETMREMNTSIADTAERIRGIEECVWALNNRPRNDYKNSL